MRRVLVRNDRNFVARVTALLAEAGINTWIFGGWAEELRGLVPPRDHADLDLLCPADDFSTVDAFLATERVSEILLKRFPHKRAFEFEGIRVELFLVQKDETGHYTNFWGSIRYDWPADIFDSPVNGINVASSTSLIDFRKTYAQGRLERRYEAGAERT